MSPLFATYQQKFKGKFRERVISSIERNESTLLAQARAVKVPLVERQRTKGAKFHHVEIKFYPNRIAKRMQKQNPLTKILTT